MLISLQTPWGLEICITFTSEARRKTTFRIMKRSLKLIYWNQVHMMNFSRFICEIPILSFWINVLFHIDLKKHYLYNPTEVTFI